MSGKPSTCEACGCALSEGAEVCPLCGTPVSGSSNPDKEKRRGTKQKRSGARSRGARKGLSSKTKRKIIAAGVAAGVVILAVVGIAVFWAWSADENLRQQAEQVETKPRSQIEGADAPKDGRGSTSGAIAGGGVAVLGGKDMYWAQSNGVFCREGLPSQESSSSAQKIVEERAACLNVYGNALYYLASAKSATTDAYRGTSVCCVEDTSAPANNKAATVLYRAKGSDEIGSLVAYKDNLYFVVIDDAGCSVMQMDTRTSKKPQELMRLSAEEAWIFIEDGKLNIVSTTASTWKAERKVLADSRASWSTWASGSGRMKAACVSEGILYYSLEEGREASHLYRQDSLGGFSEYSDVAGVLRIAAGGDMVVTLTQKGGLFWIDTETDFCYDLTSLMNEHLKNPVPASIGLSVVEDWICCVDGAGSAYAYNVNKQSSWWPTEGTGA